MNICRVTLINFKRFRRLTIDLSTLAHAPKLVLLTGANGVGKSSVFDAFEWISKPVKDGARGESTYYEDVYYVRFGEHNSRLAGQLPISVKIDFVNNQSSQRTLNFIGSPKNIENFSGLRRKNLFYGRSASRQTVRVTKRPTKPTKVAADGDRPRFYIDSDERFQSDVFLWKNEFFKPLNNALKRILCSDEEDNAACLRLVSLAPPFAGKPAVIKFEKGATVFDYDLLSSGEKEIFGILLNLLVRRESFQDTIYFIDELDVHLNTNLQYAFLKEITENLIPENCQLWTASHSLGFIQYAKESKNAAILNFDRLDFDAPQIIAPQPKENLEIYEIAVPQKVLSEIFRDKSLTFCENEDVAVYNSLGLSKRLFLPAKDKNDVYFSAKNNPQYFGLMDKDYLTPQEIELIRRKVPNLFALNFYSIESYFYHPENLAEVIEDFDTESYRNDLQQQKQNLYEKVIYGLKQARDGYKVLAHEKIICKNAEDEIISALKSDNFEEFYPYLDMKKRFKHGDYNVSESRLSQTEWFNQAVSKVFNAD